MLNWILSILGHQKDMESKCLQTKESEWLSSPNSPNDLTVSKLVSAYSKKQPLRETQILTIRTRYNTWEKDGVEIDF